MINRSTPVAIATAVLLAGCSLIPTYERPAAPVAAQYTRANATAAPRPRLQRSCPGRISSRTHACSSWFAPRWTTTVTCAWPRSTSSAPRPSTGSRAPTSSRRSVQASTPAAPRTPRARAPSTSTATRWASPSLPGNWTSADVGAEGSGPGPVPGDRGSSPRRADQPGGRCGQRLVYAAGRRATAEDLARHAADP